MRPLTTMALAILMLTTGCVSHRVANESMERLPMNLEPAKDGKIVVLVSGNTIHQGQVWIQENANLAEIEDLVGVRPEWASRSVTIIQNTQSGTKRITFRIAKMTRKEKEAIELKHGDEVHFHHDGCFG